MYIVHNCCGLKTRTNARRSSARGAPHRASQWCIDRYIQYRLYIQYTPWLCIYSPLVTQLVRQPNDAHGIRCASTDNPAQSPCPAALVLAIHRQRSPLKPMRCPTPPRCSTGHVWTNSARWMAYTPKAELVRPSRPR